MTASKEDFSLEMKSQQDAFFSSKAIQAAKEKWDIATNAADSADAKRKTAEAATTDAQNKLIQLEASIYILSNAQKGNGKISVADATAAVKSAQSAGTKSSMKEGSTGISITETTGKDGTADIGVDVQGRPFK